MLYILCISENRKNMKKRGAKKYSLKIDRFNISKNLK